MASRNDQQTLRHDTKMGEVDPRTYPLLAYVRLHSAKIGSTERQHQLNRLTRAVDKLSSERGERQLRIHYTRHPEKDPVDVVEVRIQCLTLPEAEEVEFLDDMRSTHALLAEEGATKGWDVLPNDL